MCTYLFRQPPQGKGLMFLISFTWYRHKGSARGSDRPDRAERSGVGGASPGAWEGSQGRQSAALGSLHTGATLGQTGLSPTKVRDTGRGRQVTACCPPNVTTT